VADHDNGYKLLFSNPKMIADLLVGFVHQDWVQRLDLTTLERVNSTFVSERMRERESDVIWRVRMEDGWLYVYVLLEFQSTVDPYMSLRTMTYVGMLQQYLVRERLLSPSGKLPPVVPVVLYNGIPPWDAPRDVSELVEPVGAGLEQYSPPTRYFVLDERRLAESDVEAERNVAAAVFRLERSQDLEEVDAVVSVLLTWLDDPKQAAVRRSITEWMLRVLFPARLPEEKLPQAQDLLEVKKMIADHGIDWSRKWKEKGLAEGRAEGQSEILQAVRRAVLEKLERRFGPLPSRAQAKLAAIDSPDEIVDLASQAATAGSLEELGLL
jgi:predicted transposase/invertase (TIGR01784 family)